MVEYTGAIHIHSVFSDGTGSIDEIAGYANECGLDFIILTDHNTLRALHEGFEGWHNETFLLVGCEINDKQNKNHYLALGINETFSTRLPAKEYVAKVKEAGGIGFLAHPNEKRNLMKKHPPYPWTEWDIDDFTGIEIWNHMSEWMEGLTDQNKYNYFIHPLKSIYSPPKETLEIWDKISMRRNVVGIGGVDAHAHKINLLGLVELEVFPYKVLFKSIRTHILLDEKLLISNERENIDRSKKMIYAALAEGRCFVSNFYHGDAGDFRFFAQLQDGTSVPMGSSIDSVEGVILKTEVPAEEVEIRLICNGMMLESSKMPYFEHRVKEKGAYRIEVYRNKNAWIFSNHIRIGL